MSISHPRWRLTSATIAAGLVVLFAAGACGAGGESNKSSSGGNAVAPAQGGNADAGAGAPDKAAVPGQAPVNLPDTRSIIYTGTITVQVTKVDDAATKAAGYATAAGGFVGGDERKSDSSGSTAQLTLRVPAAKFQDVVDELHGLGKELTRALSSQDVTADVADVNARLANAEASVTRVRALMDKAQTITDITTLESELSRRESDLESLQARQRALTDQTSLSTITVSLYGPDAPVAVTTHKTKTGFVAGLSAGWEAFVVFLVVVLTVLGALLPWLVALAIVGVLPWLFFRRRRRARLALVPAGVPGYAAASIPPSRPAPVPVRTAAPGSASGFVPPTSGPPMSGPPAGLGPIAGPGNVPPRGAGGVPAGGVPASAPGPVLPHGSSGGPSVQSGGPSVPLAGQSGPSAQPGGASLPLAGPSGPTEPAGGPGGIPAGVPTSGAPAGAPQSPAPESPAPQSRAPQQAADPAVPSPPVAPAPTWSAPGTVARPQPATEPPPASDEPID